MFPLLSLICFVYFQEVTLHRQNTEQKVGLTLCYGSADDEITDIFVGEVCPVHLTSLLTFSLSIIHCNSCCQYQVTVSEQVFQTVLKLNLCDSWVIVSINSASDESDISSGGKKRGLGHLVHMSVLYFSLMEFLRSLPAVLGKP